MQAQTSDGRQSYIKLAPTDQAAIEALLIRGCMSQADIARMFDLSPARIRRIRQAMERRTRQHRSPVML